MSAPQTSLKAAGGNITITAAFADDQAVGSIVACQLQWNARIAATPEIIIPISEYWLLTDLFASSPTDATPNNPQIEFRKDNDRLLDTSQFLLNVLITAQQRPNGLHAGLGYEGGSHMTANAITTTSNVASANMKAIAPYEKTG